MCGVIGRVQIFAPRISLFFCLVPSEHYPGLSHPRQEDAQTGPTHSACRSDQSEHSEGRCVPVIPAAGTVDHFCCIFNPEQRLAGLPIHTGASVSLGVIHTHTQTRVHTQRHTHTEQLRCNHSRELDPGQYRSV